MGDEEELVRACEGSAQRVGVGVVALAHLDSGRSEGGRHTGGVVQRDNDIRG